MFTCIPQPTHSLFILCPFHSFSSSCYSVRLGIHMSNWPTENPVELRLKFPFREPGDFIFFFFPTYKKEKSEKEASAAGNGAISLLENTLSSSPQYSKTVQKAKSGYENWETWTVLNTFFFFSQFLSRVERSWGASGSCTETEVQTINNIATSKTCSSFVAAEGHAERW